MSASIRNLVARRNKGGQDGVRDITQSSKNGKEKHLQAPANGRKQPHPQSLSRLSADEEDDAKYSVFSDSDDESSSANLLFRTPLTVCNSSQKCDWCEKYRALSELVLTTQTRESKHFCSETCLDMYRDTILKEKVCEWCKRCFPVDTPLVVAEPSYQSVPLQFCNTNCLNRYKMELFCMEVKEQLQKIDQENLQIQLPKPQTSKKEMRKILITPELWSEGEDAVKFVSDTSFKDTNNNSSAHYQGDHESGVSTSSLERKRKGHSVESVVNKLSRQITNERGNSTEVNCTASDHTAVTDKQASPMNLSVTREKQELKQERNSSNNLLSEVKESKMEPVTKFIPLPVFIPVPIPIPFPISFPSTAISQTNTKLSHDCSNNSNANASNQCTTKEQKTPTHTHNGVFISQRLFKEAIEKSRVDNYRCEEPE